MIKISRRNKIIATIVHLAMIGTIISINIFKGNKILELGKAISAKTHGDYLYALEMYAPCNHQDTIITLLLN
jgi:hypothetical protein